MLVRCLYASRVETGTTATIMRSILEESRKNNLKLGVTGVLICTDDCFVQVLEGGRAQVCEIYNKIASDARHINVTLMAFEEIAIRSFEGWSMGEVSIDKVNPALLLKYSPTSKLAPFTMSGPSMLALLNELVASGTITCGNAQRQR